MLKRVFLLLLLTEICCFGPYFFKTGFYLDDWVQLCNVMPGGKPDFAAGVRAYAKGGTLLRPAEILHFPLIVCLAGNRPWHYRLILMLLEMALGALIFLFLERLTRDAGLSLLAALLGLTYPNFGAMHIWWTMTTAWAAMIFLFASLWLHLRWMDSSARRPAAAWLLLGQICYLIGLLEYEAIALLPAMLAGGIWVRDHKQGESAYRRWVSIARKMLPYCVTLALAVAYQRIAAGMLLGSEARPVVFSLKHAWDVYAAGLAGATTQCLDIIWDSLAGGWRYFYIYTWAILVLISMALAAAAEPATDGAKKSRKILLAVGASAFAASFIPYILTGVYTPRVYGVMSRVHMAAGMGEGMILAAIVGSVTEFWKTLPVRRVLLALVFFSFCVSHWALGSQWTVAWQLESQILNDIQAQLPPGPATIILSHTRPHVMGAPVFWDRYDTTSALRFVTGRKDIAGQWAGPASRYEKDALVVGNDDTSLSRYPYRDLYFYDGRTRKVVPASRPRAVPPPEQSEWRANPYGRP